MMHLFKKKQSNKTAIIFDIGSGHIGASVAVLSAKEHPTIVYNTRVPMVFQEHIDFERFLNGMLKTLQDTSVQLQKEGLPKLRQSRLKTKKIDTILCVFSSPWYISQTRIIKIEKRKSFQVSKQFIDDMITRSEHQFEKSASLKKVRKKLGDSTVIEKYIIRTALNGYHTNKPHGKHARTVEISLFLSMISKEVEEKTRRVIEKTFHPRDITFHSFALSSFSVIRDMFHSEEDFVLVDVGGEVTDVSLIRKGILLETVSFPTGKNFLLRSVTLDLNTIPEEAHSLLRMHIEGKLDTSSAKLEKALDDAEKVWIKSMQHALVEVGDSQLLPKTLFMTVDPDLGGWFKSIMQKDDFKQYTFTNDPFTVITVGEQELYRYCHLEKGSARDPFLALETLFQNKLVFQQSR